MQKKTRMDKQQKIQEVTDKLGPLYKEKELLEKKIIRLFNQRKKLKNDLSADFSATIPLDLSKITKEQWEWILYGGHDETESQYNFLGKIIKSLTLINCSLNSNI